MADRWEYDLNLPPKSTAPDVEKRLLRLDHGGEVIDFPVPLDAEFGTVEVAEGESYVATVVDVDNAANESPASPPYAFTVVDDIAPGQPGELSFRAKREIFPSDPAPVPPEEEPTGDEPAGGSSAGPA